MLSDRPNGRRRLVRPQKRLLDGAERSLSRPNCWRMVMIINKHNICYYYYYYFYYKHCYYHQQHFPTFGPVLRAVSGWHLLIIVVRWMSHTLVIITATVCESGALTPWFQKHPFNALCVVYTVGAFDEEQFLRMLQTVHSEVRSKAKERVERLACNST